MTDLDQLARVVRCAKQLQWGIEHLLPQFDVDQSLAEDVSAKIEKFRDMLEESIDDAFPGEDPSDVETHVEVLRHTYEMLEILGYRNGSSPIVRGYGSPTQLRRLPPSLLSEFTAATRSIAEYVEARRKEETARADALKAVDGGVFQEWVERNPGAGAIRSLGPFQQNPSYDLGELYSWTDVELFEYYGRLSNASKNPPGAPPKPPGPRDKQWVVCTTYRHCEVDHDCGRNVELITEARAARIVLDSDESISPEILTWAKANAEPAGGKGERPEWNPATRTLKIGDKIVRKISSARATNVLKVLEVFQEEGWPTRIDSPFPPDESTVRDTVKSLNASISGMEFRADGTGEGIEWARIEEKPNEDQNPEGFPF